MGNRAGRGCCRSIDSAVGQSQGIGHWHWPSCWSDRRGFLAGGERHSY